MSAIGVKIMHPSLCRSPKIFKNSRNDLRSIVSPQKNSTLASRRPAKLSSLPAPPPGEEWDVDDEEAMASPLFSVTPHSNKRLEENAVFSPFAPAIPRSPNQMQTNIKSEKYLSSKDASVTSQSLQHRPSHSAMALSPTPAPRRQGPALRHLRPNSSRVTAPNQRGLLAATRDKSWDEMVSAGLLKVVLPFCSIGTVTALMKVSKKTRTAREVKRRFRETILVGLDGKTRHRLWTHVTLYTRKDDSAKRYFRPAVHCSQDIRNDISRTPSLVPGQQLTHKQQISMMRLLDAVSLYNFEVGYCQGMNYIAALLVQVVESEEDCFWLMNSLMTRYKLKKLLQPGLSQLKLLCFQLDCLLQHYLPKIYSRMKSLEISTEVYAAKWFITLLSYELPRNLVERVWDLFFLQGWKVIFRVILALLSISKEELVEADSTAVTSVLKSLARPGKGDEMLLRIAFNFKVTRRILKDLKKLKLLKCKGVYQLIPGKNRKLEWLVTPSSPHYSTTEASDDSNLASRILSKVMYLFKKDDPEPENEEENLDSTICLDELPVPIQVQNTIVDDLLAAVPIKDLDSGKVIYVRPDEELCCICGSTNHSSRYCTQDKNGALWVFPKAHQ